MHLKQKLAFLLLLFSLNFLLGQVAPVAPSSGAGSLSDPYQINVPGNLTWIGSTLGSASNVYFIQTSNIDLTGLTWIPLPDFRGKYDGNGFEIQNMTINRPTTNNNGLFLNISWGAEIKNLGVTNASVTGQDQNGILAYSINHGNVRITNCYIKNSTINGRNKNGGFSYYAYQTYFQDSYVENITINGENYNGAFSQYFRDSYLDNCFATGTINATGNYNSGLVEQHHTGTATINNCYSRVDLNLTAGSTYVGGLVARVTNGSITNSYYAGNIDQEGSPGTRTGGLFGYPSAGNSSGCFWDSSLTPGITSSTGRAGYEWGTAKTTTEMNDPNTYSLDRWDFIGEVTFGTDDIWEMDNTSIGAKFNDGYPFFSPQNGIINTYDPPTEIISAVDVYTNLSTYSTSFSATHPDGGATSFVISSSDNSIVSATITAVSTSGTTTTGTLNLVYNGSNTDDEAELTVTASNPNSIDISTKFNYYYDNTAPSAKLTYKVSTKNRWAASPGETVLITANFYEIPLGTVSISATNWSPFANQPMTKIDELTYEYSWVVPSGSSSEGFEKFTLGTIDRAGNSLNDTYQSTLIIGSLQPTQGNGTVSNPYQVSTPGNLAWIEIGPSKNGGNRAGGTYFVQTKHIDLIGLDWVPLFDFRGKYNGNGFEIQNMVLNRPYDNLNGLFLSISWGAEMKNMGITNASVTGQDQNGIMAFSIDHNVHITNCYIKNSTINGRNHNGGFSYYSYYGYFEDCYVDNITINGENYNGAFSQYFRDSYLENCFATGTINATGNNNSGLVEQHHTGTATINNCYSRVDLNLTAGSTNVGGLVARVTNGSITNSYYAGNIDQEGSPGSRTGGLFGYPSAGNSSGCYWDSDLTPGITTGSGRVGYDWGTAKTTTEMKTPSTFTSSGWSTDIWSIEPSLYPSFNFIGRVFPVIDATVLAPDNTTITVSMSALVFNTDTGTGALQTNDFNLSLSGGTASLVSATPTSISIDGTSITLGFNLTGTTDGTELLKVNPVDNSIFDIDGNEAGVYQINNEVTLIGSGTDTDSDGISDILDLCASTPSGETVDANGCSDSQKDTDADGVNDALDLCASTPTGETVDSNGCSDSQKDTDADGVNDALDLCVSTPTGETVDSNGCSDSQKDTDTDGVNDALDLCASTPTGETVDANGCSDSQKDTDADGVNDALDLCASSPTGETVDSNGCSDSQKDTDADGVNDALDLCVGTPTGETVDSNGCSDSQKDTDTDGVNDALDLCASTPTGETVDSNGCSDSQKDTDADGVNDALDLCDSTPTGEAVDSNGCSDSQKDTDADGVNDALDLCDSTPTGETVDSNGCSDSQKDADADGVNDALDLCDSTPTGEAVDSNGCSDSQKDTDADGVNDALDLCASTSTGETVDANGCSDSQKDTDADGINDALDLCDSTPTGEAVDSNGCSDSQKDTDADGVNDALDLCASTPTGETVDSNGCSDSQKDTDTDGVNDALDLCASTPTGETVDSNGCSDSQKDMDTDGDGTINSIDNCVTIFNADQTDTDHDGIGDTCDDDDDDDGILDSNDVFPLDAEEDSDADNDGIGDNADNDDDNDGTIDAEDAFQFDPDEDTDTDGDGIGDHQDDDDDNDGILDTDDAFPLDDQENSDNDNDGIGDAEDNDDDNDGIIDAEDNFPFNAKPTIIAAEAFTPNGDGINDSWIIPGIENYPNATVSVYNRWGHTVFSTKNYQNDWKGSHRANSNKLPPGSYMYIITFGNGSAPLQGWLFINY